MKLDPPLQGVKPLPLAKRLPLLDSPTRVYVIGHPGGRDLAFSLQDNELLDHEGPPSGKPVQSVVSAVAEANPKISL